MIDVMKRLEELDTKNPNINNPLAAGTKVRVQENTPPQLPDLTDLTELKALSGLKPVAECGMMGMSPMADSHPPVATFSINATAAGGDEVASMLTQIMNLAGVHKVGPQHMPGVDGGGAALTSTPAMAATPMDTPISTIAAHGDSGEIMRAMMDKMNDPPEDEGQLSEPVTLMKDPEPSSDPNPSTPTTSPSTTDTINNPPKTDYSLGAAPKPQKNYSLGDPNSFINKPEDESMGMGQEGDMGSMADEIRGMADELSDMEPEDIGADAETDEGSIVGGVWTADPPKPGQPNVPAPSEPDDASAKKQPPKAPPPPKKTSDSGQVDQPVADAYQHPMRKMMDMIDNESYDNTPADPNNIPAHDSNKMAWNPNAGGHNKGVMNQPSAMAETLADQLFSDYKKFVAEAAKPSAGMSKGEKSSLVKKAKAGKDIGKPGKSFDKVAAKAGGGEKGKKIAAAAMWKNAAK